MNTSQDDMDNQELSLKRQLKLLLAHRISPVILQNCIDLIEREQVGIKKYGVTLTEANLSRNELLQHAREEALDLANYLMAEQQRASSSVTLEEHISTLSETYASMSEDPLYEKTRRSVYKLVSEDLREILDNPEDGRWVKWVFLNETNNDTQCRTTGRF